MNIKEINEIINNMHIGSKSHFIRFLCKQGVFTNYYTGTSIFYQLVNRNNNKGSEDTRKRISECFDVWRYQYGGRIKQAIKEDVIKTYNEKLKKYWGIK